MMKNLQKVCIYEEDLADLTLILVFSSLPKTIDKKEIFNVGLWLKENEHPRMPALKVFTTE